MKVDVVKNRKNPAAKGSYPSAHIQQSSCCGEWGHEERENMLGRAVPRSVTGISGLTLYLYSQQTGYNGCDVALYGKHTGFHPGLKTFHFHTLLLSTIE